MSISHSNTVKEHGHHRTSWMTSRLPGPEKDRMRVTAEQKERTPISATCSFQCKETLNNCPVRPERSEAKSKDALSRRERRLKPEWIRGSATWFDHCLLSFAAASARKTMAAAVICST